jgi:pyruvate formate lyase activating enzyme
MSLTRLQETLERHTIPAAPELVDLEGEKVHCHACAFECRISEGRAGVCCVRTNREGMLKVPGGYVAGLQIDPIEKKPFFHVYPGREALSFGMLGCNFRCPFCQNWISSQVLKDERSMGAPRLIDAGCLAQVGVDNAAPAIVSTYNEPLITSDWSRLVFDEAKKRQLTCGYVSNGFATRRVMEFLRPVLDIMNVDLKCFDEDNYRKLGGRLKPVLDTIALLKELGIWVEVVTLVVPEFNSSEPELRAIANFIAGVSPDIPWHVTAFHPDYRMTDRGPTNASDIDRAYNAGKAAGLRYVYAGNKPGDPKGRENTYCHQCGSILIERHGFTVRDNRMEGNLCPECRTAIPGVWETAPPRHLSGPGMPRRM